MSHRCSSLLRRGALVCAAIVPFALLTGCAVGTSAPEGNSFVANATIKGQLYGGNLPVVGSTITLYAVGTTGYGAGATKMATTTTGSGGAFSFTQSGSLTGPTNPVTATYGCPSNSTLLYLVASSGDPTSQGLSANYNSNIKLLDAIGACSGVASNFYNIDEVASVVSVAALQQYINPVTEQIGSPSTTSTSSNMSAATTGIANAFSLVASMLNYGTGTVNATYSPTSTVGTVTATPEVAKINTMADVLAACVNTTGSTSSACISLEAAATPPTVPSATNFPTAYGTSPVAGDTLQALLFMLTNPADAGTQVTTCNGTSTTSNLACLYSLASSSPPFTGLTAAPTDWTVGVTYASASTQTVASNTVAYLSFPTFLAVDKLGNIWVTNAVNAYTAATGNGLTELSPTGGIEQQVMVNSVFGPKIPTIDPAGNVWVPNFGSSSTSASNTVGYEKTVVEFPANGSASSINTFNVAGGPFSIASDGAGNIFVAEATATISSTGGDNTPGADIEKIPVNSTSGTTGTVISPSTYAGHGSDAFAVLAVDNNFRLWVDNDSTTVMAYLPGTPYSELTTSSGVTDGTGLAIDSNNNVWVANYITTAPSKIDEFTITSGAIAAVGGSPYSVTDLTKTYYTVLDGAGNTWNSIDLTAGPIVEAAATGATLSPSVGFLHTYHFPQGIAVDPSGNVWIGSDTGYTGAATAAGTNGPGGAAAGGYITEIIGAAVPVVTPIAAGLPTTAGGTSHLATAPQ